MLAKSHIGSLPRQTLWLMDQVLYGGIESLAAKRPKKLIAGIVCLMLIGGFVYGAIMGSYSESMAGIRLRQMFYSGAKVPLLLFATFLLSLPSFYVANSMLGLRSDFGQAIRAILTCQAALTIVLAGLGPITCFLYFCGVTYYQALGINALMFGLASVSVQVLLRRLYQPLIARDKRHAWMVRAWLVIYTFVGIQMGWILRPFIGAPELATSFFREEAWGNAYLEVIGIFYRIFFNL
jgi:hypothetical protein